MFVLRRIAFVFLITAATAAAPQDATPAGMVAFFTSQGCPVGWTVAAPARGRLIVAAKDGAGNGTEVGTPLSPATSPAHNHKYTARFTVPWRGMAAASCCNETGAAAGQYTAREERSYSSNSDLPYVQLTVCQKQGKERS